MNSITYRLRSLITDKLTPQSDVDKISASELREVQNEIANLLDLMEPNSLTDISLKTGTVYRVLNINGTIQRIEL